MEAIAIEQRGQPLPRRELSLVVLLGGPLGSAAGANALLGFIQSGDAIF
jgi:hypothetical protein